jgi:hypothetical protein
MESVDLIKDGLPRAAMRMPGKLPMLSDVALNISTTDDHRPAFTLIFGWRQQGAARWSIGAAQLGLDRLSQVLQEVEAVSDLLRLWRAFSRTLRIQTAAIAADDFDFGMLAKPLGRSSGRAVRQHIDNLPPLQIHDDGPVSAALAPTPVIEARNANCRRGATSGDPPLQLP